MEIKFLFQGISADDTIGEILSKSFLEKRYDQFKGLVAFASSIGTNLLNNSLKDASHIKNALLCVGIDQKATSKEALETLLQTPNLKVIIFHTNDRTIFHPKIYLFLGDKIARLVIGSSNLTNGGLFSNQEASLLIDFDLQLEEDTKFIDEMQSYYQEIFDITDPNTKLLTPELLDVLSKSGVVPTEMERLIIKEKIEAEYKPSIASAVTTVKGLFPSRKSESTPIIYKKIKRIKPSAPLKPLLKITMKRTNSIFWIQTGALTGGSGNQLDLSMTGKLQANGSVNLFGIKSDAHGTQKDITLIYEGKSYIGNTIKFPLNSTGKTNGTWRLQMKGRTTSNESLSPISKTSFKNKVMIFNKVAVDTYEIEVKSVSEIDQLIKKSKWHDRNPGSKGRKYGSLE